MLWEATVFGGRPIVVPSGLEGMRDVTVTAGAVSLEQRMIGWRVGWMVSRAELAPMLAMVHIYNGSETGVSACPKWFRLLLLPTITAYRSRLSAAGLLAAGSLPIA